MYGVTNKNQSNIVEEKVFDEPLIQTIDFIIHISYRDCHIIFFS